MTRFIAPLAALRRGTFAPIAGHAVGLDLTEAAPEIRELGAALERRASSVRASHFLLQDQANTDALTGLSNRRAFIDQLDTRFAHATTDRVGILFIDLDDFKVVNDALGHTCGDDLLRIVAQRLRSVTRGSDTVARLGGDEFGVLVGDSADLERVVGVATQIKSALGMPATIGAATVSVACSIGIAFSAADPADQGAAEALIRDADFAMYTAKNNGKDRFEIFAEAMHTNMVARVQLRRELAEALRLKQLELFYQPIMHIDSNTLLGFEGLLRWRHPTRGLLTPDQFISVAEDTGDIVAIGAWVIDQGCRDFAARFAALDDGIPGWVSLNVSAKQFNGTFVDVVREALRRHDVAPSSLVIEVTEAVAVSETTTASGELAELRSLGVHIALDDFGTGYSSLRALADLPVDVIKIDRSFVSCTGKNNDAMLGAIVTLARGLDLQMIAEGIETPAELERLRAFGVDRGQGYLFARPMPAPAAARFTRRAGRSVDVALTSRSADLALAGAA